MTTRLVTTAVAVLTFAVPAAAQPKPPALTFQAAPAGKVIDDAKAFAREIGGDMAVKAVEAGIKEKLGDDGFLGLDLKRPVLGYTELSETADASGAVVVVPITAEAEFLGLLKRLQVGAEAVAGDKGFYKLESKAEAKNPPTRLRFAGSYAYLGVNVPDAALAAKNLVAPKDLELPSETATFAYRLHVSRIPAGLRKQGFEAFDKFVASLEGLPGADVGKDVAGSFAKWAKRLGEQILNEGDVLALRVRLDPAATEGAIELAFSGKKGSPLAADIAARKPTTNRFAAIAGPDAVGSVQFKLPLFTEELRAIHVTGLEAAQKAAANEAPPVAKPAIDEFLKGLIRTAKAGEFDVAAALAGPDAADKFTAAAAFSYDDTAALEKALRALLPMAPDEVQKVVKLDVAKVDGVALHEADLSAFVPPQASAVFGDKAVLCVALGPKGVYFAYGPAARKTVTAVLQAKVAPARVVDVAVNPARAAKLAGILDGQAAAQRVAEVIGAADAPISAFNLSVEGGDELRIRFAINMKLFGRGAVGTAFGR